MYQNDRSKYHNRALERSIAATSDANRDPLVRYLEEKEGNGAKLSSRRLMAYWAQRYDAHLQGRRYETTQAADVSAFLRSVRTSRAVMTASQASSHVRSLVYWLNADEPIPRSLSRAFRVLGLVEVEREPVTDDELKRLLGALRNLQEKALVQMLRDTGFRLSELLALNVGSIRFDAETGARIVIPATAPDLKTGPRTIYVVRSVSWLRAQLLQHPERDNPEAAFFVWRRKDGAVVRMSHPYVNTFIWRACKRAGLRRIHPHLFRYTRVTEAAHNGWNEAQMRVYFGWSRTSRMPAHYTRLGSHHMEERILRDAGVTAPRPTAPPTVKSDLSQTLANALAELLRRGIEGNAPS